MTTGQLREAISEEIRKIPDVDLEQALSLLHRLRLGRQSGGPGRTADIMRFAGMWRDAPELDGLEDELTERQRAAFKTRRTHAPGAD